MKVNGSERPLKDYVKVFYNRCALRPSCYECPYATTERKTDMTIGDFWHIEETIPDFYDPNGNSLFLIHTDRGEELFEKIRDNLDYRLSNTTQCWQANLEAPTQKSEQRDAFWNDYQKKGIDFVMKKYGTVPMKTKVKNGHTVLRPSCYECPYKSVMHPGDITIADYWGIEKAAPEFDDNKGVSLVLVNNEAGEKIFEKVKKRLIWKQTKLEDSILYPMSWVAGVSGRP